MSVIPTEHDKYVLLRRSVAFAAGSLLLSALIQNWWSWARIPVMTPRFADLRMVTSTADCIGASEWNMTSESCDFWGRAYNYSPVWAKTFSLVGIGEDLATEAGFVAGVLVIAALTFLLVFVATDSESCWRTVWMAIVVVSPPIALQIERGNTDGVVFLLLLTASLSFKKRNIVSVACLALAVGLKFFPALIVWYLFWSKTKWRNISYFVLLTFLILLPSLPYLNLISQRTPYERSYSFGSSAFAAVFWPSVFEFERTIMLFVGSAVLLVVSVGVLKVHPSRFRGAAAELAVSSDRWTMFNLFGLTSIGAFLSGTRYDYSLIFFVPVACIAVLTKRRNFIVTFLWILILVAMWGAEIYNFVPGAPAGLADVAAALAVVLITAILIAAEPKLQSMLKLASVSQELN